MVQFCINCGTKLEEDYIFCTNCGTKVNNDIPSSIPKSDIEENQITLTEKREAKRELKRITGGFLLSNNFSDTLHSYGLKNIDGINIQEQLKHEINSGKIKRAGVEPRLHQLILEYKYQKEKEKKEKIKTNEFKKNKLPYIENIIKESNPDIELATFEKRHIENLNLDSFNIVGMKRTLNTLATNIINEHEKVGDYDFAGILVEDGGFTNRVDIISLQKNLRKAEDYRSNVFLKIFENNIKIVGSEIKPFSFRPRTGRDMTIFFRDITTIDYSNNNSGEIYFNLNNNTKLKLEAYKNDEKYIANFYKILNNTLENFKNNENKKNININEKDDVNTADKLIKYAELYEKGLLNEEEFNAIKKKLLKL